MIKSILAMIATYSIFILSIGQVTQAITPTNSGIKIAVKDKSCSTCSALDSLPANPLDRLAILGRQSQNNSLLPIRRSSVKGFPIDFVSSSTGELAFAVTDLAF